MVAMSEKFTFYKKLRKKQKACNYSDVTESCETFTSFTKQKTLAKQMPLFVNMKMPLKKN